MAIDPNYTPKTSTFKPMEWDIIAVPVDSISTAAAPNLPGELLDYTIKYHLDWILASGISEVDFNNFLKKELAGKLAEKMMEDGHFSFTKHIDHTENSVRYKAYTWVGNKDFIEQQRKNKR